MTTTLRDVYSAYFELRPEIETESIKKFEQGHSVNGQFISNPQRVPVALDLLDRERVCFSCGTRYEAGTVVGIQQPGGLFNRVHCTECIEMPAGQIGAWLIQYKLARKSKKNPTGWAIIDALVTSPDKINEFVIALTEAIGREVKAVRIVENE